MKKTLLLFAILVFSISCVGSIGDLINEFGDLELDDEKEYECYDKYAILPLGTHPPKWITPPNSHWECRDGDTKRLHADGTVTGRIGSSDRKDSLEYWQHCQTGTRPPDVKGKWFILEEDTLCFWYDLTHGVYTCAEGIDYKLDSSEQTVVSYSINAYIDLYDSRGNWFDNEYEYETCTLK